MAHMKHGMLVQLDMLIASFQDLSNRSRLRFRKGCRIPHVSSGDPAPLDPSFKMLVEETKPLPRDRSFRARRFQVAAPLARGASLAVNARYPPIF